MKKTVFIENEKYILIICLASSIISAVLDFCDEDPENSMEQFMSNISLQELVASQSKH